MLKMKFLLAFSILSTLTACQPDQPITKKPLMKPKNLHKAETIIANTKIKNISLSQGAGKIFVANGPAVLAKYEKIEWREWCLLHHKEEKGTLKLMVENTSITGQGGCVIHWTLTVPETGNLNLNQAAGSIKGEGKLSSLKIQLAAGNLTWKNGNMPLGIQVAAGNVDMKNMTFPEKGESIIQVGTGNLSLTSPKGQKVTTTIDNAIGKENNSFAQKGMAHKLKLKVAVGKVNHKAI
jgi:hypothetical protein